MSPDAEEEGAAGRPRHPQHLFCVCKQTGRGQDEGDKQQNDQQEFLEALHNYLSQGDGVVVVEFCGSGS